MMIRYTFIAVIVFLFVGSLTCNGQVADSAKAKGVMITLDGPSKNLGDPLFILSIGKKNAEFTKTEFFRDSLTIKPDWITSINVLKGQDAIDKYGIRAQHGAIHIELKNESFEKLSADMKGRLNAQN